MYDNSQALKEKVSVQQLADKVAFDEWCMLNWHCCGGKKAKQNNKRKNYPPKISPQWNLTPRLRKCDTETYWQIWNIQQGYVRRQQVEAHCYLGKHLSICGGFAQFNLSQMTLLAWQLFRAECRLNFNKHKPNQTFILSASYMWSLTMTADESWAKPSIMNWKYPQCLPCLKLYGRTKRKRTEDRNAERSKM